MDAANLTIVTELLLIAVAVAVTVKYIRLPYTVALVLVGLAVGFTDIFTSVHLSKEVILFVFLPPLLFEGTINMDLNTLKKRGVIVGTLALLGTFISTFVLGMLLAWLLKLPLPIALLLGAIITPTDPVSVLATFKEYGVVKGLSTIVEGESVFNDGIGVVIYLLLLQYITGHEMTLGSATSLFLWEVAMGGAIGVLMGLITHLVLSKIDDHVIEVLLSLILAYGSYLLAERVHCSGVVAVVCAGLIIGNYGRILSMSPKTRLTLSHFWEVISFAVNSLLFLLIGMDLDSGALFGSIVVILIVFGFMIMARSMTVYLLTSVLGLFKKHRIPWSWRHVANWAGLRGSIPIALALGIPATIGQRSELINIVFGVVLLSLLAQGLTIKPLLRKLKLIGSEGPQSEYEGILANRIATKAAIRELKNMHEGGEISDSLFKNLLQKLQSSDQEYSYNIALLKQENESVRQNMFTRLSRRIGYAQHTALQRAYFKGVISDRTFEEMVTAIDSDIDEGMMDLLIEYDPDDPETVEEPEDKE